MFGYWKTNLWILFCIIIVVVGTFLILLGQSWLVFGWDETVYFQTYRNISSGGQPFMDFFIEYPPLVAYFLGIPAIFSQNLNFENYQWVYKLVALIFVLLFCLIYWLLAKKLVGISKIKKSLILFLGGLFFARFLVFNRYDLFPAICQSLGLLFYLIYLDFSLKIQYFKTTDNLGKRLTKIGLKSDFADRNFSKNLLKNQYFWLISAYFLLLSGVALKIYPVLSLAVIFLIEIIRRKWFNILILGVCSTFVGLVHVPFYLLGRENFIKFLAYQGGNRDIQIESLYANLIYILEFLKILPASVSRQQNGAIEIINDYAHNFAKISSFILLFCLFSVLIFVFVMLAEKIKNFTNSAENSAIIYRFLAKNIILGSLILVSIFILLHRVFSPQYLVWILFLLPLLNLTELPEKTILRTNFLFWSVLFLTWLIFPLNYWSLVHKDWWAVALLTLRNTSLVWFVFDLFSALTKK